MRTVYVNSILFGCLSENQNEQYKNSIHEQYTVLATVCNSTNEQHTVGPNGHIFAERLVHLLQLKRHWIFKEPFQRLNRPQQP